MPPSSAAFSDLYETSPPRSEGHTSDPRSRLLPPSPPRRSPDLRVAAVGGGIEDAVVGPAFDAALERRLQRLVRNVPAVEGEIIAEQETAPIRRPQHVKEPRQR